MKIKTASPIQKSNLKLMIAILFSLAASYPLTMAVYASSYFVHEGGHALGGFLDNRINGIGYGFEVSNWMHMPGTPSFVKVPQQTKITQGMPSLNSRFGGMILVVTVSFAAAHAMYARTKKRRHFLLPILFFYHEFFGNFLCGTDNLRHEPHGLCSSLGGHWLWPFLIGLFLLIFSIFFQALLEKYPEIFSKGRQLA